MMRQFSRNTCFPVLVIFFGLASLFLTACGNLTPTAAAIPLTLSPSPSGNSTSPAADSPRPTFPTPQGTSTAPATATPPVYSGLKKGKLKEVFPVLEGLVGSKSFRIQDDWDGLSQIAPTSAHYNFELKGNQFEGEGVFSIEGRSIGYNVFQEYRETARNISIPLADTKKFLQMLADTTVEEGNYRGSPIPTHTDDYPTLIISIETGYGNLEVFSRSQKDNFFPFTFTFSGKHFTGIDAAAFDAFNILKPYLQKEILQTLINGANNTPSKQIQAPRTNPAFPSLLTNDFHISLKTLADSSYSALALSPDNKTIATGIYEKGITLYNASDGNQSRILTGSAKYFAPMTFSQNGRFLAGSGSTFNPSSAKTDYFIYIWDIQSTRLEPMVVLQGTFNNITSLAFSPDGKTLAAASDDRTIRLWDFNSSKQTEQLKGKIPEFFQIFTIAFSPDGKTLAGAGSGDALRGSYPIKFWDVATGQELPSLKGHTDRVYSLVYSSDGKTIASAGNDGIVRLWDLIANKELVSMNTQAGNGYISEVAFSPDRKQVVSAHQNGIVVLWDTTSGNEISETVTQLSKQPYYGFDMAYSKDGKFIITANKIDGILNRWKVK